jgi:FkbM family methyltransferase
VKLSKGVNGDAENVEVLLPMEVIAKFFDVVSRFANAASDWGWGTAWHSMIRARRPGNGRFRLRPTGWLHYRGGVDHHVLNWFSIDTAYIEAGPGKPIRTIIDAGANIGCFTAFAKRHYPNAQVFSLEIDNSNFEVLQKTAETIPGVKVVKRALWSCEGPVAFLQGDSAETHSVAAARPGNGPTVEATTVAALVDRYGLDEIDILKMDIEGAEGEVIGTIDPATLERINAIIFECNDSEEAGASVRLFGALQGSDFDGYAFGELIYLIRRRTGWSFRRRTAGRGHFGTAAVTK